MKILTPLLIAVTILLTSATCNKTTSNTKCFKGRLEIKGICMNYVIKVLEGNTTALQLDKKWTDETDGKTYENVFALGNKCNFPDIKEGEEFYFTVTENASSDCAVCQAYRVTPAARNNIIISKTPCP